MAVREYKRCCITLTNNTINKLDSYSRECNIKKSKLIEKLLIRFLEGK